MIVYDVLNDFTLARRHSVPTIPSDYVGVKLHGFILSHPETGEPVTGTAIILEDDNEDFVGVVLNSDLDFSTQIW